MTTTQRPINGRPLSADDCMAANTESGEVCTFKDWHRGPHSWAGPEPIMLRAQLQGVHRSTKKGVGLDFAFLDVDLAVVTRLFAQVSSMVGIVIVPESEQQSLPGMDPAKLAEAAAVLAAKAAMAPSVDGTTMSVTRTSDGKTVGALG